MVKFKNSKLLEGDIESLIILEVLCCFLMVDFHYTHNKPCRTNEFIEGDSNKIINTDRFHFAMNAQWSDNKTDVHSISVERDLINWFKGLLNHLKKELEYVKDK